MRLPHRTLPALLLATTAATGLAAQEPQAPRDSIAERLRRAEEAIDTLRSQLGAHGRAGVSSRSGSRIVVSGLILVNGFRNDGKTDNSDVPSLADTLLPSETAGLPNAGLGGTIRQTRLGVTITGARALGAELSGDLQLDFFGGQLPSPGSRSFPLPRIRTASFRLDWRHVGLLVGQEAPLISQRDPASFASAGAPLFSRSGNLWLWIPQARLTWETAGAAHFGLQGAALAPLQYKPQGLLATQPDSAERSSRPFLQGRTYLAWGSGDAASEIGIGAHVGWIATAGDSLLRSSAVAADFRLALGEHLSLSGEAFSGQALAALGGGGIGQDFGFLGLPIRSRGGWVQLDVRPSSSWAFGGGFGLDDPTDEDFPTAVGGEYQGRLRNVSYSGHLIVQPGGGLLAGMEFRRIETTYGRGMLAVHHLNAYAGLAF